MTLRFVPVTLERWKDLETLFGPRGACAGCWCMWWRMTAGEYRAAGPEGRKRALRARVRSDNPPGLLAYDGDRAIGWVAIEPRERFPRLATARTLQPIDDRPVWSAVCFFVAREWRHKGLTTRLLRAAADYARMHGATMLEGYPVEPGTKWADAYAFTGHVRAFEKAGFRQVARPSKTRAIMRKAVRKPR